MDPINLQRQIRNNSDDLVNFCSELKEWGEEMKRKDAALKAGDDSDGISKLKSDVKKPLVAEQAPVSKSKSKKRIKASDYKAWDKYDAEAECAKLDEQKDVDSGDLTDEVDEDAQDQAIYEKEKGNNFVKQQKWDQGIACYTKAIEYYAYDPIFYANRALCYLKIQKYKEAECDCTSALQLDKSYVKAYQRRAAAREALNQLTEAHTDLLRVFDYEPNNKESKNALSKLEKKLENINIKPKTEPFTQRPKSQFTLSRQQKSSMDSASTSKIENDKINMSKRESAASKYWSSGNDIELIEAIDKPPHLRSRKPLRRIPIQTVDGHSESLATQEAIQPWPRPGENNPVINCADLKIVERKDKAAAITSKSKKPVINLNKVINFDLGPPLTSIQFASDWRSLGTDKNLRYKYLKQIDPHKIPTLFKESLDCDIFSGIIQTLAEDFINNYDNVFEYLLKLSEVKRFSMLTMFMSESDKKGIAKLSTYMYSNTNYSKNEVTNLISKYT